MKPLLLTLALSLLILTAACSPATPATTAPPLEFTLTATDIAYDQTQLQAIVGQPVKLTLRNDGALEHDFSIAQIPLTGEVTANMEAGEHTGEHDMSHMSETPDLHIAAAQAGSSTIEFTPSEPGEYPFYCTVAGHKEAGMVGTLVVTAQE